MKNIRYEHKFRACMFMLIAWEELNLTRKQFLNEYSCICEQLTANIAGFGINS